VELRLPFIDAAVTRHDDTDFVLAAFDTLGKGSGDVREASGLGEWLNFA